MRKSSSWLKFFAIAFFLDGLGLSMYYTYSRPYIIDRVGEDYGLISLVAAAELAPSVFSILAGLLGDKIGRSRVVLVGVLRLPPLLAMPFLDIRYAPLAILVLYLATAMYVPNSLGTILEAGNRSGEVYAWITLYSGIGWALGGVLPGILEDTIGSNYVFPAAGILMALPPIIQYMKYPLELKTEKILLSDIVKGIKESLDIALAILLSTAGLTLFYSLLLTKIYVEVGNLLLYGFVTMSLAALTGSLVRPLAGKLVDKYNPDLVLALSLIAYAVLNTLLYMSRGIVLLLLWLIPVFPFRDTAQTIAISRKLPLKLQATAAGIMSTLNSLAGILIACTTPAVKTYGLVGGYIIQLVLLTTSLLLLQKRYLRKIACLINIIR